MEATGGCLSGRDQQRGPCDADSAHDRGADVVDTTPKATPPATHPTRTDHLRELKGLLDEGLTEQDEYDRSCAQLLTDFSSLNDV